MLESHLIGSADVQFAPVIQAEQPQSNVAQIIAVLSGRDVLDVRAHFHRDGGRWKLRNSDHLTCSDGELCLVVEWFIAAKSDRWND